MSSWSRINVLAAALAVGTTLGGCSDIYWDRRETIALGANDAVETNKIIQIVDPWPPRVANRNFAFNGQRVQAAQQRYRENKVVSPVNVTTSSTAYQKAQQDAAATLSATQQATSAAPAAPVRGP